MGWYQWQGDALILKLRVQPRSGRTGFGDLHGDERKVRLRAPPLEGRANDELQGFIADTFGVKRDAVSLLSGARGRSKRLRVRNPDRLPAETEGL